MYNKGNDQVGVATEPYWWFMNKFMSTVLGQLDKMAKKVKKMVRMANVTILMTFEQF